MVCTNISFNAAVLSALRQRSGGLANLGQLFGVGMTEEMLGPAARAQGFEYVLDSTQGGGVIMSDGKNLLDDVKKELGF